MKCWWSTLSVGCCLPASIPTHRRSCSVVKVVWVCAHLVRFSGGPPSPESDSMGNSGEFNYHTSLDHRLLADNKTFTKKCETKRKTKAPSLSGCYWIECSRPTGDDGAQRNVQGGMSLVHNHLLLCTRSKVTVREKVWLLTSIAIKIIFCYSPR